MLTLHGLTTAVLIAIPLAGLLLTIAALIDAHVPLPPQPVTKERTHDQEDTRTH